MRVALVDTAVPPYASFHKDFVQSPPHGLSAHFCRVQVVFSFIVKTESDKNSLCLSGDS